MADGVEYQDQFNKVLTELSKGQCEKNVQKDESNKGLSGQSLELKSKESRTRLQ